MTQVVHLGVYHKERIRAECILTELPIGLETILKKLPIKTELGYIRFKGNIIQSIAQAFVESKSPKDFTDLNLTDYLQPLRELELDKEISDFVIDYIRQGMDYLKIRLTPADGSGQTYLLGENITLTSILQQAFNGNGDLWLHTKDGNYELTTTKTPNSCEIRLRKGREKDGYNIEIVYRRDEEIKLSHAVLQAHKAVIDKFKKHNLLLIDCNVEFYALETPFDIGDIKTEGNRILVPNSILRQNVEANDLQEGLTFYFGQLYSHELVRQKISDNGNGDDIYPQMRLVLGNLLSAYLFKGNRDADRYLGKILDTDNAEFQRERAFYEAFGKRTSNNNSGEELEGIGLVKTAIATPFISYGILKGVITRENPAI